MIELVPDHARRLVLPTLLLLAVLLVGFYDVVLMGQTLVSSEQVDSVFPWGKEQPPRLLNRSARFLDPGASAWSLEPDTLKIHALVREGQLPLWNRNIAAGTPLAAAVAAMPFAPLRIPVVLIQRPLAWDVYLLARLLLAGLFTYGYLRAVGLSQGPSMTGGISFMLCGYLVLYVNMLHGDVDLYLPLMLWCAELSIRRFSWRTWVATTLAGTLPVLAQMPESLVFLFAFTGLYFATRVICTQSLVLGERLRRIVLYAFALLAPFLLCSFWIIPFLELAVLSRHGHQHLVGVRGVRPIELLPLVSLRYSGPILESWLVSKTHLAYVGLLPILLASVAVVAKRTLVVWFMAAAAGFYVLKAAAFWAVNWIGYLPILRYCAFPKYLNPEFGLAVAVLTAFGVQAIGERSARPRWVLMVLMLILLGFAGLHQLNREALIGYPGRTEVRHAYYTLLGLGVALTIVVTLRLRGSIRAPIWFWLAGSLVTANLFAEIPRGGGDRRAVELPEFVRFLHDQERPFRIFSVEKILHPNWSSAFDLDDIRTLNPLHIRRYFELIDATVCPLVDRFTGFERPIDLDSQTLNLLNVEYLLSQKRLGSQSTVDWIVNRAELSGPRPDWVLPSEMEVRGVRRPGIFAHASSRIHFDVRLGIDPEISFYPMLSPGSWRLPGGDGVEFRLAVDDGSGERVLYREHWDPARVSEHRSWQRRTVSLKAFAGRSVGISLWADEGQDSYGDQAFWGEPDLRDMEEPKKWEPVYEGAVQIYRNLEALPRAFLVPRYRVAVDSAESLALVAKPGFRPGEEVILETEPTFVASRDENFSAPAGTTILQRDERSMTLSVRTPADAILVVSEAFYPGWQAQLDGAPVAILVANHAIQAVAVPKGIHNVRLVYAPTSWWAGTLLSLGGSIVLVFIAVHFRKREAQAVLLAEDITR